MDWLINIAGNPRYPPEGNLVEPWGNIPHNICNYNWFKD